MLIDSLIIKVIFEGHSLGGIIRDLDHYSFSWFGLLPGGIMFSSTYAEPRSGWA